MALVGTMSDQQKNVYTAEAEVPAVHKFNSIKEIQIFLDAMTSTDWWERKFNHIVRIEAYKSASRTCSHAHAEPENNCGVINISERGMNALTVLHEVAHCLVPKNTGHESDWARTFMNLVYHRFGSDKYMDLYQAFLKHNVDIG